MKKTKTTDKTTKTKIQVRNLNSDKLAFVSGGMRYFAWGDPKSKNIPI